MKRTGIIWAFFMVWGFFQAHAQDIAQIDSLSEEAYLNYSNHDYFKSLSICEEILVMSQGMEYYPGELKANLYRLMSIQELKPSTYDPKPIEKLIPELEKEKLRTEKARAHSFVASIYSFFGDIENSIENHLLALAIYEGTNDISGLATVHNNLSQVYYDQLDFDEAFRHARMAISLEKVKGDPQRIHSSLNNLAIIFEKTGQIDSAIFYHEMALQNAYKSKSPYAIGISLSNLGNDYADQGDLERAEDTLFEALKIRDSLGYSRGLALTHNQLAGLYLKKNEIEKSQFHAEKSLENAERASEITVIRTAYERLGEVAEKRGDIKSELDYLKKATHLKDSILNESNTKAITQMMLNYEFKKKQLLDSIKNEQERQEQSLFFDRQLRAASNQRIVFMAVGALFFILAIGWWRRYKFVKKASMIIQREKERSEKLLLNILPSTVAEELKEKGKSDARDFEEVTVIFTDFADFTKKAQNLTAKELVHELNICFKAFDEIIEEFGLEKIKTIGDAYLAAGGLNNKSGVKDVIRAALKIQEFILRRNFDPNIPSKAKFDMRIGINTGPVVAGIVGIKKFQYDIWGDTVNTAQRMEAACGLNKINISKNTYQLLMGDPNFCFESRGLVEVKGKGKLHMWYVECHRNQIEKFKKLEMDYVH